MKIELRSRPSVRRTAGACGAFFAGLLAVSLGCRDAASHRPAGESRGPDGAPPASAPSRQPASMSSAVNTACAPVADLAALDHRRPVPLQPMMAWHQKQNMMEHLVAIERITDALAREDWSAIADASALIESSPQMQQMCQHMGAGADGFTDLALEFHRRADAIGLAAKDHDRVAVLTATARTLNACTKCHATYRQEVVDAATWQARTKEAHVPAPSVH